MGEAFVKAVVETGQRHAVVIHLLPSQAAKVSVIEEALDDMVSADRISGWCAASQGYPGLNVQPTPWRWSGEENQHDSSHEPGYLILCYTPDFVLDGYRFMRPRIMRIGRRYELLRAERETES